MFQNWAFGHMSIQSTFCLITILAKVTYKIYLFLLIFGTFRTFDVGAFNLQTDICRCKLKFLVKILLQDEQMK